LTILDAYRVLTAHGPNGGTPDDVILTKQVIVGVDPVAVDSYGARLFGEITGQEISGMEIDYLRKGNQIGLGEIDLTKVPIQEVNLS
jgi:hypothetical protein